MSSSVFDKDCAFMLGCAVAEQLPAATVPEVAFAGRSNAGKSSLLNAVVRRKGMARTSATPGRTQQLNFFNLGDLLYLVDLPGYGFAKASDKDVRHWNSLIMAYLKGRPTLRRVFLLLDARRGIGAADEKVMTALDKAAVVFHVVLTKADKLKVYELARMANLTKEKIAKHTAAFPTILTTSAQKGSGLDELRAEIQSILQQ